MCSAMSPQVQAADLKNPHFRGEHLDPNGTVGRSGVEWTYDAYLRGVDGQVAQSFDAAGHPVGSPYLTSVPQAGDTLQLNIDSHLQQVAQSAIRYGISVAHSDGQDFSTQGAIVAMNPTTGAVYALASWPSYDPSIWVAPYKGQNQVLRAAKAAKNAPISHPSPLIDRTSGEYPAGSTFKPFTAGAAWMAGPDRPRLGAHLPRRLLLALRPRPPQDCLPQLDAALDRRHGPPGGADHLLRLLLLPARR